MCVRCDQCDQWSLLDALCAQASCFVRLHSAYCTLTLRTQQHMSSRALTVLCQFSNILLHVWKSKRIRTPHNLFVYYWKACHGGSGKTIHTYKRQTVAVAAEDLGCEILLLPVCMMRNHIWVERLVSINHIRAQCTRSVGAPKLSICDTHTHTRGTQHHMSGIWWKKMPRS